MMTLTHTIVGGLVGSQIEVAAVSFVVGVFLHFLLDKIPHYWPNKIRFRLVLLTLDWISVAAVVIYLAQNNYNQGAIWGALGGASIDLMSVAIPAVQKLKIPSWHRERQLHKNNLIYLLVDIMVIIPLAFLLWCEK